MDSTITTDVLVIGSGAAGISAAIKAAHDGHRVLVIEKDKYLGGTSAISGGWGWLPGNKQGRAQGDTREEQVAYIKALAGDSYNEDLVTTFLDGVPEAMDFFEQDAGIEFHYADKAPDYQMDAPGAKASGRAVTVAKTDARILGADRHRMQPYLMAYTIFGYMPEIGKDIATIIDANVSVSSFLYTTRKILKTWTETIFTGRSFDRTNGNAMMTRLMYAAKQQGVQLWTSTRAAEILRGADGAVSGARIEGAHTGVVEARLGVIIAAGGFSRNKEMRQQYFPHDPKGDNHVSPVIGHDGDSYRLAAPFGGHIDNSPHQPSSWGPITAFKDTLRRDTYFPHLRAFGLPGLIAVDREGKRFANESLSYHDFCREMLKNDEGREGTYAWIIADDKAMKRYGIGWAKPWPLPQALFLNDYLKKERTVKALAERIGLPADALQATLDEFNAYAAKGEDPTFHRGTTAFHHFKGDMKHTPNPNLETIDKGPYYAVRVGMGDLGTYAGLAVNTRNEVLDARGEGVPGLYAVGTAAVSVFGGGYPGYGANIGPALVFGYLAGRDIAAHAAARRGTTGGNADAVTVTEATAVGATA
ncbi:FAD-dependent oxidoreductase [Raineyella fluvialis]|uniref:FAD-dependent oxidoreductase n=1 Tax=Raineyella fluvialis TaxID=2662261 RepID=A0A5Q2FDG3_9ACTN|nr:FAD-dependent oxidoreductase [Raineyella fluvialis]QGF23827.1 FAD-dependent oxidoreductase [Raineyella fluvialis]